MTANCKLIFDFLRQIEQNNNREWMEANRAMYLEAREHFDRIVAYLIGRIAQFDEAVAHLSPKECVYRINRDIRFSKDKTLYKTHFGAYIAPGGKQSKQTGYYLHLQTNGRSMIGGGMYMPEKDELKKIRQEIDYNTGELLSILHQEDFKTFFGELKGEKLKTMPKDYPKDHPQSELLKMKSFFAIHPLSDELVVCPDFADYVADGFRLLKPLNDFFNLAIQ